MRSFLTLLWLLVVLPQRSSQAQGGSQQERSSRSHALAFGSCNHAEKQGLWKTIEKNSRPDGLILLGDNVYADRMQGHKFMAANATHLKYQYQLLSENDELRSLLGSMGGITSLSATWDDHDYGINNGDKTYALRNFSQSCFWDWMHEPSDSQRRLQSGVYSSKTVEFGNFTYKIVLLDSRSNKDPVGTLNGDFLGEEQWAWLAHQLADPAPNLIILGSSIQILPEDKILEETWTEFPVARQRLLNLIGLHTAAPNLVLLSGDVHTGEVLQSKCRYVHDDDRDGIGGLSTASEFRLYEFTSSGLSHTFSKTTRKASEIRNKALPEGQYVEQVSKGRLYELAYDMYVATGAALFREHRFRDHYKGLHYGLMEFYLPTPESGDEVDSAVQPYLKVSIVDHTGETVIFRSLPLKTHGASSWAGGQPYKKKATIVDCQPYWGRVSRWRIDLARYALLLIPFIFIALPAGLVVFFILSLVMSACGSKITRKQKSV